MTSAENSNSEPPSLKFSWRRIPPDPPKRLYPLVLAINMPPVRKKPCYSPAFMWFKTAMPESKSRTGT